MIIVFIEEGKKELDRFESPIIPEVDEEIRLRQGNFVVKKRITEFYGSNDQHLVELYVSKVE